MPEKTPLPQLMIVEQAKRIQELESQLAKLPTDYSNLLNTLEARWKNIVAQKNQIIEQQTKIIHTWAEEYERMQNFYQQQISELKKAAADSSKPETDVQP